ncbi:MAG: phosphatase PAP2 family protein [Steroidobacteraceae bacterium]
MRLPRLLLLGAGILSSCATAWGQTPDSPAVQSAAEVPAAANPPAPTPDAAHPGLLSDVEDYFTAPLHWDRGDWAWFGGTVLAVGLAHRYDSQARTHFVAKLGPSADTNSHDVQDAIPAAAVFAGTFALAHLMGDSDGRQEAWAMLEAAGLSGVTVYALKFAAGRETPAQSSNPNEWFKSGTSFPSLHSTAAFAIGTVLAESGNDDYRLLRRVLGYGLGAFTSYERLKHNAHWLSDTVAGAALGIASAHFVMNRRYASGGESRLALVPIEGGAMLTYNVSLP